MSNRTIRLPNGHFTTSERISNVRVHPDRSRGPERPYLQVYEAGTLVYEGLMDLTQAEAEAAE